MAFIDQFISAMSNGQYREMYVMANYNGKVDFYVRMGTDFPADAYEQFEGDVDDPSLWWAMKGAPRATGVTAIYPREVWKYRYPAIQTQMPTRSCL